MRAIELLAPGGDIESIKAAIAAGADAIYCGLNRFNARNRATNIDYDDLLGIINLAHNHNCKIFLTLNIIIFDNEFQAFVQLLNRLVNTSLDGVIVQDIGVAYLLRELFPTMEVHGSTQTTVHNDGQISFWKKLGVNRINLCRELNLSEIEELTTTCHDNGIETEVFVHGSNCISFSGICNMSSAMKGTSGNRGRCSQPCRDQYQTTLQGVNFPFNLKDNSAFFHRDSLAEIGVDSVKIEGRIKKFNYVYSVVKTWREHLDNWFDSTKAPAQYEKLNRVFNRQFSDTLLTGEIGKSMFIDDPRDSAAETVAKSDNCSINEAKQKIYNYRTSIIEQAESEIVSFSTERPRLQISLSGRENEPFQCKIKGETFATTAHSSVPLRIESNPQKRFTDESLRKSFNGINKTEYLVEEIFTSELDMNCSIPFAELTAMVREIISRIIQKPYSKAVELPKLPKLTPKKIEIQVVDHESFDINRSRQSLFEIPSDMTIVFDTLVEICKSDRIIPWFPSILIGEEFTEAVRFIKALQPSIIATNNSGIAMVAAEQKIPWIAGNEMNVANSYSLFALTHEFGCVGTILATELTNKQKDRIITPEGFTIYEPINFSPPLMTTRQCLFHQVDGCHKESMDTSCLSSCNRTATVTNLDGKQFLIRKRNGFYNQLFEKR